mgnify:FL=1|tara:strand:- start:400 stop:1227 length:828 start_codon:yes stop_codon:yes gene_type:complete
MAEESTESTISVDEGTSPETDVQVQTEAVLEKESYSASEVQGLIREALEQEVRGLKANNQALKEEKKKASDKVKETQDFVKEIGGQDELKRILEIKKQIDADEELKLFATGDREKYNERITSRAKADFNAQMKRMQEENNTLKEAANTAIEKYRNREVTNAIAEGCASSGVNPRMMDLVSSAVEKVVFYDQENDKVMVRDPLEGGIRYGKDGLPMTVSEYIDTLREDKGEVFLQSTGSGSLGGATVRPGSNIAMESISNMSVDEYKRLREAGAIN